MQIRMQIRLSHLVLMASLVLQGCTTAPPQIEIPFPPVQIQIDSDDVEPDENLVIEPVSDSSDFINLLLHAQYQQ